MLISGPESPIKVATRQADWTFREGCAAAALSRGLRFLGVAPLEIRVDYQRFREWLERGLHADMGYLVKNAPLLENPHNVLPGATTALVFGLDYFQGDRWPSDAPARVAQYARFRDYHRIFKSELSGIATELELDPADYRVAVDTAPLLERAVASRTERGFIGKNTCYIHPDAGSFLLLGEILLKFPMAPDRKVPVDPSTHTKHGGCGICDRCQVACPTGALDEAYRLDARKCLSYWSIEHRGVVPVEFWKWFRWYWFGCDICQLVCPYNRKAEPPRLSTRFSTKEPPDLLEVVRMDQKDYERWFGGTPLTRPGRNGLRRNALIAMVAGRDPRLPAALAAVDCDSGFPLRETVAQIPGFVEGFQDGP